MNTRVIGAAALAAALAVPAAGVGMGPLAREGVTDGPRKGFYLPVSNPYAEPREFRAYPTAIEDTGVADAAAMAVDIRPTRFRLAAGGQRRILVVAQDLTPGETRRFRVCAELAQQEGFINARVCSKLAARRLAR